MSSLVKTIQISTTPDGLLLLPSLPTQSSPDPSIPENNGIKIPWRNSSNSSSSTRPFSVPSDPAQHPSSQSSPSLEIHGILGILDLSSQATNTSTNAHLLAITSREQVASIRGAQVYRIKDVVLIPLSSRKDAEAAIAQVVNSGNSGGSSRPSTATAAAQDSETEDEDAEAEAAGAASDAGEEMETNSVGSLDSEQEGEDERKSSRLLAPSSAASATKGGRGVVRDVIQQKGKYGRFAERWFSRGGGGREGVRRVQGMSKVAERSREGSADGRGDGDGSGRVEGGGGGGESSGIETLTPRILRSARMFFGSSGFYFSYGYDLTRRAGEPGNEGEGVLGERCDPLVSLRKEHGMECDADWMQFFWNKHLLRPFIDAGLGSFALPAIQGFVGQRHFTIARTDGDENDVVVNAGQKSKSSKDKTMDSILLGDWNSKAKPSTTDLTITLISRRSTKRAGLRYLRRGIDEDGNVANNVETEQILSDSAWSSDQKMFSLLQIRGSMPIFFKQNPYSFKPVPEMFGSDATNQAAFKKHFGKIFDRYGAVHAVSLVDKHGTENSIGEVYEKRTNSVNNGGGVQGKQVKFDWFDFHGVCKGMKFENVSLLLDSLDPSMTSFYWTELQNGQSLRQQSGVFRTNCMDCLDRTNVVQSAIAGHTLQAQLATLDLQIDLKLDPKTQWFNTLWADNGDAISKQYAGTAALKGDFTRTRKRNWTGALSDFSLTLNRYYNNIFSDYFVQTCIDYYLGNAGPSVFEDFETDMMSKDYAINMRQIRAQAIETCEKIVLESPEEKLFGAWTLSCPRESNTLRTLPFEECILLLTDAAIYFCRIDWTTEKVESFERIDLRDITEMHKGPYITSALGKGHLDPTRNVGFVLRFKSRGGGILRKNTRSLANEEGDDEQDTLGNVKSLTESAKKAVAGEAETRFLAFKVLPPKDSASKVGEGEAEEEWESAELSEGDIATHVCEEIRHAALNSTASSSLSEEAEAEAEEGKKGEGGKGKRSPALRIVDRDIISIEEAKRRTGYVESIGYSLKKLVWA